MSTKRMGEESHRDRWRDVYMDVKLTKRLGEDERKLSSSLNERSHGNSRVLYIMQGCSRLFIGERATRESGEEEEEEGGGGTNYTTTSSSYLSTRKTFDSWTRQGQQQHQSRTVITFFFFFFGFFFSFTLLRHPSQRRRIIVWVFQQLFHFGASIFVFVVLFFISQKFFQRTTLLITEILFSFDCRIFTSRSSRRMFPAGIDRFERERQRQEIVGIDGRRPDPVDGLAGPFGLQSRLVVPGPRLDRGTRFRPAAIG